MFSKLYCTVLFILTLFFHEAILFSGFVSQPSDDSRGEGERVYFNCIVETLDTNEYVSWLHNRRIISNNDVIVLDQYMDRYTIDFDSDFGKYNLKIRNIQRIDKGQYECVIYDSNENVVSKSWIANLTVLEIPQGSYPICQNTKMSYIVGQRVLLACISETISPLALLKWKQNDIDILTGITEDTSSGNYKVSYSFIAKQSNNREIFTCELTTPANPSIKRNCSIGPINILYAPVVRIEQTRDVILGNEAIFLCYSDANPQETTFEWSFDPAIDETLYLLENEIILRIKNTVRSFNGTSVICKVTNSIGSGSNKLIVNVKTKESIHIANGNSVKDTTHSKYDTPIKQNKDANSNQQILLTKSPTKNNSNNTDISISLVVIIAVVCIIVILGLALIPVGYMRYTRRQPSDTISRGRPVSIPDVYFEPRDHIDPMLPQLGLAAPWMRTVGVQVPGECEYDATYNTQVMAQPRQVYYTQRMYPASSL
ncbi:uncharacterized protein [Antedon mediterranea]|uniref:uncharacterized protein n=1 Tax=Antedon mediterranea TaxID=105859 RepID=UPI003AF55C09